MPAVTDRAAVDHEPWDEAVEHAVPLQQLHLQVSACFEHPGQLSAVHPAEQRISRAPPPVRVREHRASLVQPAGHRPASTAAWRPATSTDTAARRGRRGERAHGSGAVVDDLQQTVPEHEVRTGGRNDFAEARPHRPGSARPNRPPRRRAPAAAARRARSGWNRRRSPGIRPPRGAPPRLRCHPRRRAPAARGPSRRCRTPASSASRRPADDALPPRCCPTLVTPAAFVTHGVAASRDAVGCSVQVLAVSA